MALSGIVQTEFGINCEYHVITSYSWNKFGNISVLVSSYLNNEARNLGNLPLHKHTNEFTNDPVNSALTVADIYGMLKTLSSYESMLDV